MVERALPRITVSISDIRAKMKTMLHKLATSQVEYLIEKHGQEYALLVPVPQVLGKETLITVSTSKFREDLPEILHSVLAQGKKYLIEKHGQQFAVLKPIPKAALN